MSRKLKLAGACVNQTPIDWQNNFKNIAECISKAKSQHVDILVLPELCISGYGCEDLFLTDWLPQKAFSILREIVPLTSGIAVSVGLPVKFSDGRLYNAACLIVNGEIDCFYAKQKLANQGVHYEPRWFSAWPAGKLEHLVIDGFEVPFGHVCTTYKGVSISFEICEDAWQDNRPVASLVSKPELVLNPSASHFAFGKAKFREELVKKLSRDYNAVYLYANQVGNESGRMIYDGDVLIAKKGELIGRNRRLSFEPSKLLAVSVDFEFDNLEKEIQDDFETENEEFSRAAALALYDYMRKSGSKGFVLSLSGGADSSTIATLIALMVRFGLAEIGERFSQRLGLKFDEHSEKHITSKLLTTAYQGTRNSSTETLESARQLAESLGATFYRWNIDAEVGEYVTSIENVLERKLTWDADDIALQNIQARSRAPIIWMLANIENKLLLATSNRSEGDVGYATMDGDTSGSISPIAGVSKSFILRWLKFAEKAYNFDGLKFVNRLQPTAELRPLESDQTDEDDLMPYGVLLKIERLSIFEGKSPVEVYEELKGEFSETQLKPWVVKFFKLWTRNQWKRERFAPSFHFDDFNIDPRSWYRFPILSGGFQQELETLNKL